MPARCVMRKHLHALADPRKQFFRQTEKPLALAYRQPAHLERLASQVIPCEFLLAENGSLQKIGIDLRNIHALIPLYAVISVVIIARARRAVNAVLRPQREVSGERRPFH